MVHTISCFVRNGRLAILPFFAAILLMPNGRALAEIDFTPRPSVYLAEGMKMADLKFRDGAREIAYTPPANWKYEGDPSKLLLIPSNMVQAEASIEKAPTPVTAVFDAEGMKQLTGRVLASLPQGSQKVTIVSEEKDPLRINGKETFGVTISSVFFGQAVTTSVVFCNRGKEQLEFKLFCHSADFPELSRLFRGSLFSLQGF